MEKLTFKGRGSIQITRLILGLRSGSAQAPKKGESFCLQSVKCS